MLHNILSDLILHDLFQYIQTSDPGVVGARKNWLDTTTASAPVWKRRNDANDGWITMVSPGGTVPSSRAIATTPPLQGGGDFSMDRTHSIDDFAGAGAGAVPTGSSNDGTLYLDGTGSWTVPPGTGGGTGSGAGAFGSRPAAGSAGASWISTDSPGLVSVDNGASWDDFVYGVPVLLPDPADFTWFAQGGASNAAQGGYQRLTGPQQNGEKGAIRQAVLPSTTFTLIAKWFAPFSTGSSNQTGIGLRDSSGGPIFSDGFVFFPVSMSSGVITYSNLSGIFSGGIGSFGGSIGIGSQTFPLGSLFTTKMVGNGTNIVWSWSQDSGLTFLPIGTISYATLITAGAWNGDPDRIGPMVYTVGSSGSTPFPVPWIDLVSWDLS